MEGIAHIMKDPRKKQTYDNTLFRKYDVNNHLLEVGHVASNFEVFRYLKDLDIKKIWTNHKSTCGLVKISVMSSQ